MSFELPTDLLQKLADLAVDEPGKEAMGALIGSALDSVDSAGECMLGDDQAQGGVIESLAMFGLRYREVKDVVSGDLDACAELNQLVLGQVQQRLGQCGIAPDA